MAHQNGISVYGETELLDQIGTDAAAIAVRTAPSATLTGNPLYWSTVNQRTVSTENESSDV